MRLIGLLTAIALGATGVLVGTQLNADVVGGVLLGLALLVLLFSGTGYIRAGGGDAGGEGGD